MARVACATLRACPTYASSPLLSPGRQLCAPTSTHQRLRDPQFHLLPNTWIPPTATSISTLSQLPLLHPLPDPAGPHT